MGPCAATLIHSSSSRRGWQAAAQAARFSCRYTAERSREARPERSLPISICTGSCISTPSLRSPQWPLPRPQAAASLVVALLQRHLPLLRTYVHVPLDVGISGCAVPHRQGSAAGFQERLVPVRTSQLSSAIRLVSVLQRSRQFPALEERSFLGKKHNTIQYKQSYTGLEAGLAHPLTGERLTHLKLLLSCMPKPVPPLTRRQSDVLNS